MACYSKFIRIDISDAMQSEALFHARQRSNYIKRRFVPRSAVLTPAESNYIGALGELAVKAWLKQPLQLEDQYQYGKVDNGDIFWQGKIYDVKTEAIPIEAFRNLYAGSILPHQKYGCRVWTASQLKHLHKYTGGIIFVSFPYLVERETDISTDRIRDALVSGAHPALLTGYITPQDIQDKTPQRLSPPHPTTGKQFRYASENYVFHHNELRPLSEINS